MKYLLAGFTAMTILSMATLADAAPKAKGDVQAQKRSACQAQAAKRYSAVRFLARRDYVRRCMGEKRRSR